MRKCAFPKRVALSACLLALPTIAQTFKAPDYDVRVALETDMLSQAFAGFVGTEYGNTIRMGEWGCGDPQLSAKIMQPKLDVVGFQNTTSGEYGAVLRLGGEVKGRFGPCAGFGGALAKINAGISASKLTAVDDLELNGTATVYLLGYNPLVVVTWAFGVPFDFRQPLHVPIKALSKLPVALEDSAEVKLDFGKACGKPCSRWMSLGQKKEIPIDINLGSVENADGSHRYLVADLTFGKARRKTVASAAEARRALEEDIPIWDSANSADHRNVGISIKRSALSKAQACPAASDILETQQDCSPGVGLLAELLPMRVRGKKELTQAVALEYGLILDGAEVAQTTHEGLPAYRVTLSSSYSAIRLVRTRDGTPIGNGAFQPPGDLRAYITFDRLRVEDGEFQFRVAEFRVELKLPGDWPIPNPGGWFSAGALEKQLNGGRMPLSAGVQPIVIAFPECIQVGEKFKAGDGDCYSPTEPLGYLSRRLDTNSRDNPPGKIFEFEDASVELKAAPWLMLSGAFKSSEAPNLPDAPLRQLLHNEPQFVTRWRFYEPNRRRDWRNQGEAQCGSPGGTLYSALNDWTPRLRIDTDNRPGGCVLAFGLIDPARDPDKILPDPGLTIGWKADGPDGGQCGGWQGQNALPVTVGLPSNEAKIELSKSMFVDTDSRGGCRETFTLDANSKYELDIDFYGDDDKRQCLLPAEPQEPGKFWKLRPGKSLSFGIHADDRWGACVQRLRLSKVK